MKPKRTRFKSIRKFTKQATKTVDGYGFIFSDKLPYLLGKKFKKDAYKIAE